jgi:hypothetical protein
MDWPMRSDTAISYHSASDWSRLGADARLKRMAEAAHARLNELERSSGGLFREAVSIEYHLRYAEANLYDYLAGHPRMAKRESRRSVLLGLMDRCAWSPMGNRMALNEGRYRSQMVLRLADFLSNV